MASGDDTKGQMRMKMRKRIADHPATLAIFANLFAAWIWLVKTTSRVEEDGWEDVAQAIEEHGAVILLVWHQRLMMTPYIIHGDRSKVRSLTSTGRSGRVAGRMHQCFGIKTIAMPRDGSGTAEMRLVVRGLRDGCSIGIAPDGSRGPARISKPTPIQWARAAQVPMFMFAFSCRRFWTSPTWDQMMCPKPFNRMALLWKRFDVAVPRRISPEAITALARQLDVELDALTAEADRRVGTRQSPG